MNEVSIYIRPIEVIDAVCVLDWENNIEDWNLSGEEEPYSLLDILNLIHELSDIKKAGQARWIICDGVNQRQIGVVDLTEIDFAAQTASVGVLVADKKDRKNGLGSFSLSFIEKEAEKLGIKRLISTILMTNEASLRLFEKCGFTKIGKSNDAYLIDGEYIEAMLFEKWLKK